MTSRARQIEAALERVAAAVDQPHVRTVSFEAPWEWLGAGWHDLWSRPALSLAYGGIFALGAGAMLYGLTRYGWQSLILALGGGFLLLGPMMAMGLYELSRRLETGETIDARDVLFVATRSAGQLAFLGVVLLMAYLVWIEIAMVLFALFLGQGPLPPIEEFIQALLLTNHGLGLLIVGTAAGATLAGIVFAVSAFSVPLLLTRRADAATAILTSLRVVARNPRTCVLWAALITLIMGAGAVTVAGLVLAFPLIGHATWHAFRAVVRFESELEIVPDVLKS